MRTLARSSSTTSSSLPSPTRRSKDQNCEEMWNIYNAVPDDNQQYNGNSQGYIPAVRDALNARAKRTLKQLFPVNHKHVDGISSDGKPPNTQLALIEHYIRKTDLKSIVRSVLIAGDVTGQWNIYLDWFKDRTHAITKLIKLQPGARGHRRRRPRRTSACRRPGRGN